MMKKNEWLIFMAMIVIGVILIFIDGIIFRYLGIILIAMAFIGGIITTINPK